MKRHLLLTTSMAAIGLMLSACGGDDEQQSRNAPAPIVAIDKEHPQPPYDLDATDSLVDEGLQAHEALDPIFETMRDIFDDDGGSSGGSPTPNALSIPAFGTQNDSPIDRWFDIDDDGIDDLHVTGQHSGADNPDATSASWTMTALVVTDIVVANPATGFISTIAEGATFKNTGQATSDQSSNATERSTDTYEDIHVSWNDGLGEGACVFRGRQRSHTTITLSEESFLVEGDTTEEIIATVTQAEEQQSFDMLIEESGSVDLATWTGSSTYEAFIATDDTTYGPFSEEDLENLITSDRPAN